jgi:hypothetical protein
MTYIPSPSATFDFDLTPVFRAGALIQDETLAASATVTTDLTASAMPTRAGPPPRE